MIAVSQRVDIDEKYGERRDALDQRWTDFLGTCGILPLLIPNNPETVRNLVSRKDVSGILLTGGNDLGCCGGDAPERDEVETWLLEFAMAENVPVLGVCRGMQLIQSYFGAELMLVTGHVAAEQLIQVDGKPYLTNSYHRWGSCSSVEGIDVWAVADDGIVKAIRHRKKSVEGIMWHPERRVPFSQFDVDYISRFFRET